MTIAEKVKNNPSYTNVDCALKKAIELIDGFVGAATKGEIAEISIGTFKDIEIIKVIYEVSSEGK